MRRLRSLHLSLPNIIIRISATIWMVWEKRYIAVNIDDLIYKTLSLSILFFRSFLLSFLSVLARRFSDMLLFWDNFYIRNGNVYCFNRFRFFFLFYMSLFLFWLFLWSFVYLYVYLRCDLLFIEHRSKVLVTVEIAHGFL